MKRNIAIGIFLIGAMALSSCSTTTKLVNPETSDDVYFSNAKAGDEPTYAAADNYNPNVQQNQEYLDDNDDYFYYDDYASRINRFNYFSPFSFYDNLYYGYSDPYYNNGFNLGFNYGPWGYGYSPYGYGGWGLGYGYSGWGYGYGGGYWGGYGGYYGGGYPGGYWSSGYFTSGRPRPNRGPGIPFGSGGGGRGPIGVPGNGLPGRTQPGSGIGYIPGGRGTNNNYSRPVRTDARPSRPGYQQTNADNARPVQQPQYQPQVDRSSSAPSNNSGGGSRSSGGGGGGGGGRPSRP
ncbi:hypothetical protein [Mucilaginibacter sp. SG564]|uniref:hypothetical protein n=1 Tax=unclassified Mucilaginibacter TaxID=2617802 RepID=UPI001C12BAE3|nr:hypothetical protein [Mucilaginibacter sp. SG564]NOW95079.1 hypothetical protein [Mucilaginibacter sp. SG564]